GRARGIDLDRAVEDHGIASGEQDRWTAGVAVRPGGVVRIKFDDRILDTTRAPVDGLARRADREAIHSDDAAEVARRSPGDIDLHREVAGRARYDDVRVRDVRKARVDRGPRRGNDRCSWAAHGRTGCCAAP